MGTISGYDLVWGEPTWEEIAAILNVLIDKKSFTFHHKDPRIPGKWIDAEFLLFQLQHGCADPWKRTMKNGRGLSINIRRKRNYDQCTDQLLKESKENQDYYVTANVTLADGTNLPLKKKTFTWMETESWIQQTAAVSL
ncbi:MAG: hypothetical protein ACLTER_00370 [Ruminococcus sp.]